MNHILGNRECGTVLFREDETHFWLSRLFSYLCAHDGHDFGPQCVRGPGVVNTGEGRFEGSDFETDTHAADGDSASAAWTTGGGTLKLRCDWKLCPGTGVLSRRDRLENLGKAPVTVRRCLSRFALPPARYELYIQHSGWCNESQGRWLDLHAGSIHLGSKPGRFTDGGTPYLCIREKGATTGLAFHVLPAANWTIQVHAVPVMNGLPYAVVELGLSDQDLQYSLAAGEKLELPEILVQHLPDGQPESAAPCLHAYINPRYSAAFPEPPVIYNTWFHEFLKIDPDSMRAQLAAAAEIGCEVFVIDDGWYGPEENGQLQRIGDWRERTETAFCGKLKEFGNEVRAAGLGFGLWVEPEGAIDDVPVRREHPEWFVPNESNRARIDLENPEAYAWLRDDMIRVIETYDLAWLKVDFNFALGKDATGKEHAGYFEALGRLWDEVRERCPDTFIEGCASGAMRLDLKSLELCDGHFPSDNIHPIDLAHICQATLLRIPPGRMARWLGVHAPNEEFVGGQFNNDISRVAVPGGATWGVSEELPLDYAVSVMIPGILGISGTPSSLDAKTRKRLRWYVDFHKEWRARIRRSVAHLLTPPEPIETRAGWVATQFQDPDSGDNLVFAYHLKDGRGTRLFRLRGLDRDRDYIVTKHGPDEKGEAETMSGAELMDVGFAASCNVGFPQTPSAGIYSVVST